MTGKEYVEKLREALECANNGDCEQVDTMKEPACGDCQPCLARKALALPVPELFTREEVEHAYCVSGNLGHPPKGWWEAFLSELGGGK